MQIFIYGDDTRLLECKRLLEKRDADGALSEVFEDIHLLPIPSRKICENDLKSLLDRTNLRREECKRQSHPLQDMQHREKKRESKRANATLDGSSGVSEGSEDLFCEKTNLVVGYEVPDFLYQMKGLTVMDLGRDEMFLRRNARLCALGTLGVILTEHSRVPDELRVGVIGYGRIGREVCDLLSFLEAPVIVFTSNMQASVMLSRKNIPCVVVNWNDETNENVNNYLQRNGISHSIDIIINTSPSSIGKAFFDGFCGTIYDLASGKPIPEGVEHTRLSSLPMRMYAQSAGHAVFDAIVRKYNEISQ